MYLRKLSDDERPLHLRLCAGPNEKVLSLVLKENETGEVNVSTSADSLSLYGTLEPTHLYQAQIKKKKGLMFGKRYLFVPLLVWYLMRYVSTLSTVGRLLFS